MPNLVMPDVGESVVEGTITRWLKAEGDSVALDELVVEIETEKAAVEVPSPFEGTLVKILVREGEVAPVGAPLAEFKTATIAPPKGTGEGHATRETVQRGVVGSGAAPARHVTAGSQGRLRQYSPVVLKLAAEHAVDLSLVQGTGIEGRVTRRDVERYVEYPVMHTRPPSADAGVVGVRAEEPAAAARRNDAEPAQQAGEEVVPLSATRKTIATRMMASHQAVPVAWMAVEADVTGLVRLRERVRADFERREGVKLTYLPFFVQAIVAALKRHPALNATYTDAGVQRHARQHAGIAVAAESGLVVPVIRDAGERSIAGLAHALEDLGGRAHARKLTVEEMRGATFTIDNTGAFGSILSQPIVPPGQVAIITTEAVRQEVRATDDAAIRIRYVMNLCMSFDHRALDGAEAGAFMRTVKEALEAVREGQPIY